MEVEQRQEQLTLIEPDEEALKSSDVIILPPADVIETLESIKTPVTATILDPWYNRGVGGGSP